VIASLDPLAAFNALTSSPLFFTFSANISTSEEREEEEEEETGGGREGDLFVETEEEFAIASACSFLRLLSSVTSAVIASLDPLAAFNALTSSPLFFTFSANISTSEEREEEEEEETGGGREGDAIFFSTVSFSFSFSLSPFSPLFSFLALFSSCFLVSTFFPSLSGNLESLTKGKKVSPCIKGTNTSGIRTPSASW